MIFKYAIRRVFTYMENKPAVLLIHDISEKRLAIRNMISDFVRIYAVKSGQAAKLALEKAEKIKLIILDLEMPAMFGYEFLDFLKNSQEYGGVPVLVITGSPQKEIVIKLKSYGNVAGVIGKTYEAKELREMTAEALGVKTSLIETR